MDRCAAETGRLVLFDRDEKKPWNEQIFRRSESNVEIWGHVVDGFPADRQNLHAAVGRAAALVQMPREPDIALATTFVDTSDRARELNRTSGRGRRKRTGSRVAMTTSKGILRA